MTNRKRRDRVAIRQLLMTPRDEKISFDEVAMILGLSPESLTKRLREIGVECSEWTEKRFDWHDRFTLAGLHWCPSAVEAAMGGRLARYVPPLVLRQRMTAMLPGYQIRLIEVLAKREGITSSDVLTMELDGLAASYVLDKEIEAAIEGFSDAVLFPLP